MLKQLNLDRRELVSLACGAVALLLVLFLAVYIPAGPKKDYEDSVAELDSLRSQLKLTKQLEREEEQRIAAQERLAEMLKERDASFDLFSFVEEVLRRTALREHATLDNETSSRRVSAKQPMVKLEFDGVSLQELVGFLHELYASENLVAVYRVDRLEPKANKRGLECRMTLVTLKV